jgi:hypothetical protein
MAGACERLAGTIKPEEIAIVLPVFRPKAKNEGTK